MIYFEILNSASVSRHPLHEVEGNIISDSDSTTDSVKSKQRSGGVLIILLLFQNHYFELKIEMINDHYEKKVLDQVLDQVLE